MIDESSFIESSTSIISLVGIFKSTSLLVSIVCKSANATGEPMTFLQLATSFGGDLRISIGFVLIQFIYCLPTSI